MNAHEKQSRGRGRKAGTKATATEERSGTVHGADVRTAEQCRPIAKRPQDLVKEISQREGSSEEEVFQERIQKQQPEKPAKPGP